MKTEYIWIELKLQYEDNQKKKQLIKYLPIGGITGTLGSIGATGRKVIYDKRKTIKEMKAK